MPPEITEADLLPGTRVRIKADPGRVGVLTGRTRCLGERTYQQVQFPDGPQFVLDSQLERVPDEMEDPLDLMFVGRLGRSRDLRGNITHIRLSGRLANVIYSMETTNTDFFAYQFKPVLNFLEAPGNGILIADEVGLGKTIEAGLIWTELRSRFDIRRVLVLCPAMLQEKWQGELAHRFGIEAEITNAKQVLGRLRDVEAGRRSDVALIASMQGLRPRRGWDTDEHGKDGGTQLARYLDERLGAEPLLDLVIIDEAHYLRNPESMTAKLGRLLRAVSSHLILLSATPIHLRSADLYNLLNLVDEDTFNRSEMFDLILQSNEPLVIAREAVLRRPISQSELVDLLNAAKRQPFMEDNRQLQALLDDPPSDDDLKDNHLRSKLAARLESMNLLSHTVTRTRKRDVKEWSVVRQAVPEKVELAPQEHAFYNAVTDLVRRYAERRGGHEGFLLVTPQRQMSSSMAAALQAWQDRTDEYLESLDEDLGTSPDEEASPGPLVRELIRSAHAMGNAQELRASDSKYKRLRSALKEYLGKHPKEKIVLFAYFRPTLSYLSERLVEDGISNVVLTGATEDKYRALEEFREPSGPSVLLSSEVASEGIDLQFARVIVNYDLPWNPMKVEQRIGRLDRIGQRSPTITIWNLFYANTIDERIYERLYERIKIFERALGGMEAILGEQIRELSLELLLGDLTPKQQEARIEQTAQAIAYLRTQEESLEEQAGNLMAHGDYILNQVKAAHELQRWITADDLFSYVSDFFGEKYPGCKFVQVRGDELLFDITLSSKASFDLDEFLGRTKRASLTRMARSTGRPHRCLFDNRMGGTERRGLVERISQVHPIVRFVSEALRSSGVRYHPVTAVRLSRAECPEIQSGDYVFIADHWSLEGLRSMERLVFALRTLDGRRQQIEDDLAEHLVTAAARAGTDWLSASNEVDLGQAAAIARECLVSLQGAYDAHVLQVDAENNDRADVQEQSLRRHLDRQLSRLKEVLEKHRMLGRTNLIPATEGQMRVLREQVEKKLEKVSAGRNLHHHRREICVGLIRVE